MKNINHDTVLTFGRHIGEKLADVPASYLLMLYHKNIAFGELRTYIFDNMEVLNAQSSINNKGRLFNKKYYIKK
jgi:uncharacterized protein (DUF3820 family)